MRLAAPVASVRALLRSRRWVVGALLAYGGIALNATAMALVPLWLTQSMIAATLVAVGLVAARRTGIALTRRDLAAAALLGAGLLVLAASAGSSRNALHPGVLGLLAAVTVTGGGAGALWRVGGSSRLGLVAGILYGATTIALATFVGAVAQGAAALTLAAVFAGGAVTAAGFFAFQRGLQGNAATPTITQMTAAMNAVAIAGGLVLGGGAARLAQAAGLAGLCAAGWLTARGAHRPDARIRCDAAKRHASSAAESGPGGPGSGGVAPGHWCSPPAMSRWRTVVAERQTPQSTRVMRGATRRRTGIRRHPSRLAQAASQDGTAPSPARSPS